MAQLGRLWVSESADQYDQLEVLIKTIILALLGAAALMFALAYGQRR